MSSSLLYAMKTNHFLIRLWCVNKKQILYDNWATISSVDGPRRKTWEATRNSKTLPKAKLRPKKRSQSLFVGLLKIWFIQLSESWRNHYIWEVCSANPWDTPKTAKPKANICQKKGPNFSVQQNPTSQCTINTSTIFTWPLVNWPTLLQASQQVFEGQMLPQPARRKCFPRVCQIPKHRFLCYKNKQTYFSFKKCVDCNSSCFD